jgi:predicted pyridoxine 5'-phosphate oxidase superfamily flavin-nucleotide-binding protein
MITEEMIPAMQGFFPAHLATCSLDGTPNCNAISQAYYIDEFHLSLSFQFFNKTIRNVRENPVASLRIIHPATFDSWDLLIKYERSETEGDLFDQMEMQLEAIASMTGMSDIFKLQAADIYQVLRVEKTKEKGL